MTRMSWLLVLVGCSSEAPIPVTHVANTAPKPAGRARRQLPLSSAWETVATAPLEGIVPAGPYPAITDLCAAVHATGDACRVSEQELASGPFASVATIKVNVDTPYIPIETMYVAVHAATGWYAMRFAELEMMNRAGFFAMAEPADDALVLRYSQSEGNRFDERNERGIVVCKPVDGTVACTPRVALHEQRDEINTSAPGWSGSETIDRACAATYANGVLLIGPEAAAAPGSPPCGSESRPVVF